MEKIKSGEHWLSECNKNKACFSCVVKNNCDDIIDRTKKILVPSLKNINAMKNILEEYKELIKNGN